jgi:hypothetical protein
MYLTGRQFYDRRISFWGALLFQYLPVSAQHLSDGISEPAYLLFLVCGLLQAVHAVRDRSVWRGALCGMFTGLAYLIRPEGLLILPALGLMLIVVQLVPAWRGSWTRFASCGAAAALSVAVFIGIFFSATGKITTKPSVRLTVGLAAATQVQPEDHVASGNRPLFAASFPRADQKGVQFQRSVWALCMEINHGLLYIAGLPALFGFLWLVNTLRREPGFWVMAVYFGIHAFILVKLAMAVSYISDRHVMSLVMTACFYVAVGFHELPRLFLAWRQSRSNLADAQSSFVPWHQKASVWCTILMVALIGACVPKAAQRLHGNRAGNHAAGIWLADHVKVGDVVEDDHAWSHFFSGLILAESRDPILPADAQPTCYVVATRSRDASIGFRNEKVKLREDAAVVYRWPENVELVKARVVVYAQPREMEFHPWRVARQ